ncbi:uncharacterized protein TNCV_1965301 [Trichonephila clavipes]|nr:uncharacterized protein TNCV_1965301 [Trichonephila clavipes]
MYLVQPHTIVLARIQKEPNVLKTSVANRVAAIQHQTNTEQRHHVSLKQNPTDLVSRGLDPSSLHKNSLWWNTLSSVTDNDEFNCEFKRANAELKRLYKLVINPDPELAVFLVDENINWKFLPPRAPNFDGLWEAGVKSSDSILNAIQLASKLIGYEQSYFLNPTESRILVVIDESVFIVKNI